MHAAAQGCKAYLGVLRAIIAILAEVGLLRRLAALETLHILQRPPGLGKLCQGGAAVLASFRESGDGIGEGHVLRQEW